MSLIASVSSSTFIASLSIICAARPSPYPSFQTNSTKPSNIIRRFGPWSSTYCSTVTHKRLVQTIPSAHCSLSKMTAFPMRWSTSLRELSHWSQRLQFRHKFVTAKFQLVGTPWGGTKPDSVQAARWTWCRNSQIAWHAICTFVTRDHLTSAVNSSAPGALAEPAREAIGRNSAHVGLHIFWKKVAVARN